MTTEQTPEKPRRGKPANAIPSKEKMCYIPTDVLAKVELHLYSEVQQKVPHGAFSKLVTRLLEGWLGQVEGGKKV